MIVEEFTQINKRQRPSILKSEKIKSGYGDILPMVINQESSGEESSEEMDSDFAYKEPSLKRVCEYIFDNKTFRTIDVLK